MKEHLAPIGLDQGAHLKPDEFAHPEAHTKNQRHQGEGLGAVRFRGVEQGRHLRRREHLIGPLDLGPRGREHRPQDAEVRKVGGERPRPAEKRPHSRDRLVAGRRSERLCEEMRPVLTEWWVIMVRGVPEMDSTGIELFSWSLCWAGALGAFLLDLVRWAARFQSGLPPYWRRYLMASGLLIAAGGGTAGLFGGIVQSAVLAAAIGAGAPGVLRTMATGASSVARGALPMPTESTPKPEPPPEQQRQQQQQLGPAPALPPWEEQQRQHGEEQRRQQQQPSSMVLGTSEPPKPTERPTWLETFAW